MSVSGQELYSFNHKVINWGFKVGLNANSMMSLKVFQGDNALSNVSSWNRNGNDVTGFFRVNLDRFFIQPELTWTTLNKDILFSFPSEEDSQHSIKLSFNEQTINANGLIGYNITKTGPFVFNGFVGTSLRYGFNTRYSVENSNNKYRIDDSAYNLYGLFGFSMNISNVHFDIRYMIGILAADMKIDQIDGLEGITISKNENILSFSCGVMF